MKAVGWQIPSQGWKTQEMEKCMIRLLIAGLAALFVVPACAQEFVPTRGKPVIDAANVIDEEQEAALNARLLAFWKETGRQIAVATTPGLEGYEIEDYGIRYARFLKLGSRTNNDGVLILLAPRERKVRIEVGRSMEEYLTDAKSSEILRNEVTPLLKKGLTGEALTKAADKVAEIITPDAIEKADAQRRIEDAARRRTAEAFGTFMSWMATIVLGGGVAGGVYWVATIGRRRRAREAAAKAQELRNAETSRIEAAQRAQRATVESRRRAVESRQRAEERRRLREHQEMLDRMSPTDRAAYDRKIAVERASQEAARAVARRKKEKEEAEERSRRRDDDSSGGFSGGGLSGGASDNGGFSGGGGDFGGGGSSDSY